MFITVHPSELKDAPPVDISVLHIHAVLPRNTGSTILYGTRAYNVVESIDAVRLLVQTAKADLLMLMHKLQTGWAHKPMRGTVERA